MSTISIHYITPKLIFCGKRILSPWGYSCKLADERKKRPQTLIFASILTNSNAKKCTDSLNRPPPFSLGCFLCMVIHKYYHSMTMQFHQGTSQSRRCESHTTDGDFGGALRTLRVLLTGYIAVATLSPVWRCINESHASTFC
jgi:hypothetical protein